MCELVLVSLACHTNDLVERACAVAVVSAGGVLLEPFDDCVEGLVGGGAILVGGGQDFRWDRAHFVS
ncbi:hypothetical protein I542_5157 [Mycobacteroides abscessus 1948]|uniref:Uncharacterized protein n=1 Tax=Mycobacteroides abscessus 1948 TaxID=1299323 RepID=A0A829QRW8_9MYCO|nr:hypothetical protein I542_5157 [Mycobacteroides abscessus 1948]